MVLKKYMISATAVAVLTSGMVSQGFALDNIQKDTVIERNLKQSNVSISVSDKTIKKGSKFNPKTGVTAKDYNGKDITQHIIVTYNKVNENQVGEYKVGYAVLGSNGKRVDVEITVKVVSDSTQKESVIIADDITIPKGSTFDPLKGVKATDITGKDITKHILVSQNTVNTSKADTYTVKYVVLDTQNVRIYKTRKVTVSDTASVKETVITAEDKTIEKGSTFDPMKDVKAIDITGKDITKYLLVVENTVNTDRVGAGKVKYLVLDTQGNRVYKTITVTVSNGVDVPKTEIIANDITLNIGDTFEEKKDINAIDITGKDITQYVLVTKNNVNTEKSGQYNVTYVVLDTENNRISKTITVTVVIPSTEIEKAQNIIDRINALNKDILYTDLAETMSIRAEYNKLIQEAKDLVTNYSKLEEAEAKLEDKKTKVFNVVNKIGNLPKKITLDHKAQVQEARNAYNALTDDEKEGIYNVELSILISAELTIAQLEESARLVEEKIASLNKDIVITDYKTILEAREAFDALSPEAKLLITNLTILENAESVISLKKERYENAMNLIAGLPEEIKLEHKTQVQEARRVFDALEEDEKDHAMSFSEHYQILIKAEETIQRLEEESQTEEDTDETPEVDPVQSIQDKIESLMEREITLADKDTVVQIRQEYDALPNELKPQIIVGLIEELEMQIEGLEAVKSIQDKIESLQEKELTLEDKDTVVQIRQEYNALRSELKEKISEDEIEKLELEIEGLEYANGRLDTVRKTAYEQKTANAVIEKINSLQKDILLTDYSSILTARREYDKLFPDAKLLVNNLDVLERAEATIEAKKNRYDRAMNLIGGLPDDITLEHEVQIIEAREAFDSLTSDEKDHALQFKEHYQLLTRAEEALARLKNEIK